MNWRPNWGSKLGPRFETLIGCQIEAQLNWAPNWGRTLRSKFGPNWNPNLRPKLAAKLGAKNGTQHQDPDWGCVLARVGGACWRVLGLRTRVGACRATLYACWRVPCWHVLWHQGVSWRAVLDAGWHSGPRVVLAACRAVWECGRAVPKLCVLACPCRARACLDTHPDMPFARRSSV